MCIRDRKIATDGVAETFGLNNIGPRPDSLVNSNFNNYEAGHESLRQQLGTMFIVKNKHISNDHKSVIN